MKYTVKVDTIPFDYWQSSTMYNVGDWLQFNSKNGVFPWKIIDRTESKREDAIFYTYKLG